MASEPRVLIYLLRRDLRVADNPIFHQITQAYKQEHRSFTHVLPLYVFSSKQIEVSGFLKATHGNNPPKSPFPEARSAIGGFWRCGPHRAKFLAECVYDLKTSLEYLHSGLAIRLGHPADVIDDAFKYFEEDKSRGQITGVWMTEEATAEEILEQNGIKRVVQDKGKDFKLFKDEKYFVDE
jgi:deoxyribodipyrimidine photo-lyase